MTILLGDSDAVIEMLLFSIVKLAAWSFILKGGERAVTGTERASQRAMKTKRDSINDTCSSNKGGSVVEAMDVKIRFVLNLYIDTWAPLVLV